MNFQFFLKLKIAIQSTISNMSQTTKRSKLTTKQLNKQQTTKQQTTKQQNNKQPNKQLNNKQNNKAIRIYSKSDETKQLTTFLNNLGISEETAIYKYVDLIYIDSNIIVPVLNINIKQFVSSARQPKHYIIIKKRIYVNKYGLTKLIAQSDEEVSYRLQDYIYEVIYKLEKEGSVKIPDVESREALLQSLQTLKKTEAELEIYQTIDSNNQEVIKKYQEEINILRADIGFLEEKTTTYKTENSKLQEQVLEYEQQINKLTNVSKKLARYVRFKNPIAAKNNLSSVLDEVEISDEEDPEYTNVQMLTFDAMQAKKELKSRTNSKIKSKTNSKTKTSTNDEKSVYYILRSNNCVHVTKLGKQIYNWQISTELYNNNDSFEFNGKIYKSYKAYSKDYMLGNVEQFTGFMLWYKDIILTNREYTMLSQIFDLISNTDEDFCNALINIFDDDTSGLAT